MSRQQKYSLALPIALGDNSSLPTEIRLFAYGENSTSKGVFWLTKDSAKMVMDAAATWGNRYSFDYEHSALDPNVAPHDRIAAGWFDLELRDDGLYAVKIEWTARATELLTNKEFKYYSPTFLTIDRALEQEHWWHELPVTPCGNAPALGRAPQRSVGDPSHRPGQLEPQPPCKSVPRRCRGAATPPKLRPRCWPVQQPR